MASDPATATPETDPLAAALRAALSPDQVSTDPEVLAESASDKSSAGRPGRPRVRVLARSTEDVSAVLRLAYDAVVPVVPQGARTSVTGASSAVDGCVLLDLSSLDRIVEIRPDDQLAVVQPGVVTSDLAAAVAEHGLFYPVDPGSFFISTVGGNIATNAGGMRCVKYGVTRDRVRSLTAVLADGTVVRTGHDSVKGVAGYDLTALLVGSEGTLAVVTEATLALLPAPGEAAGAAGMFGSLESALDAAARIMAGPRRPSALELLDGISMRAINAYAPSSDLPEDAAALLIVESDEVGRAATDVEHYVRAFEEAGALGVRVASTGAEVDALLNIRRNLHPGLVAAYGGVLTEDVAAPRARLQELLTTIERTARETGAVISTGGHVGDGNLHPLICFDPDDEASRAAAQRAFALVLERAVEVGGTVSGEHGIGLLKRDAVTAELSREVRDLQVRVKAAFDPRGILNPGKKV
ncbi:FAD-binding oxidoreductase [Luteimicrobium sp. DT211]|uniref:FAD-binding oxidoreductase n=1 Tax=Luteimicrobium sp. DT211 TaxID=3393412 RepID=UPI003CF39B33